MNRTRLCLYPNQDVVSEDDLQKAEYFVESFSRICKIPDINDFLEYGTAVQILSLGKKIGAEKKKEYNSFLAKNFVLFLDENIADIVSGISNIYINLFWSFFDKFHMYIKMKPEVFYDVLERNRKQIVYILQYNNIVKYFNDIFVRFIKEYDTLDEEIIRNLLVAKDKICNMYLPEGLEPADYQTVFQRYVDSASPRNDLLRLMIESRLSFPYEISDTIKLAALKKKKIVEENILKSDTVKGIVLEVIFKKLPDNKVYDEEYKDGNYKKYYDSDWLNSELDFSTIMNNFIYIFQYIDMFGQSTFPARFSQMGVLERLLGYHSGKDYIKGFAFDTTETFQSMSLKGYINILRGHNIRIEEVIQWFFSTYLPSEFNIGGFRFLAPSDQSTLPDKIRAIFSEIEAVRNQFDLYVQYGEINHTILSFSSKPKRISQIGSLLSDKYLYINEELSDLTKECSLLFSSQSPLLCNGLLNENDKNFSQMINKRCINKDAYQNIPIYLDLLYWLENRKAISILDNGIIKPNNNRLNILYCLFEDGVICPYYSPFQEKPMLDIINQLLKSKELLSESSLFNRDESAYLDYILNKAEFLNLCDLRNKYIHGDYPSDPAEQMQDYLTALRIALLTVIKINEDIRLFTENNQP